MLSLLSLNKKTLIATLGVILVVGVTTAASVHLRPSADEAGTQNTGDCPKHYKVEGNVTYDDGSIVTEGGVSLLDGQGKDIGDGGQIGSDGHYQITNAPEGSYTIVAGDLQGHKSNDETLAISGTSPITHNLVIAKQAPPTGNYSISGKVSYQGDPNTKYPTPQGKVTAFEERTGAKTEGTINENGTYAVSNLPAGKYYVEAEDNNGVTSYYYRGALLASSNVTGLDLSIFQSYKTTKQSRKVRDFDAVSVEYKNGGTVTAYATDGTTSLGTATIEQESTGGINGKYSFENIQVNSPESYPTLFSANTSVEQTRKMQVGGLTRAYLWLHDKPESWDYVVKGKVTYKSTGRPVKAGIAGNGTIRKDGTYTSIVGPTNAPQTVRDEFGGVYTSSDKLVINEGDTRSEVTFDIVVDDTKTSMAPSSPLKSLGFSLKSLWSIPTVHAASIECGKIIGQVKELGSDKPVAKATVRLDIPNQETREKVTDISGYFSFDKLPVDMGTDNKFKLSASAAGYLSDKSKVIPDPIVLNESNNYKELKAYIGLDKPETSLIIKVTGHDWYLNKGTALTASQPRNLAGIPVDIQCIGERRTDESGQILITKGESIDSGCANNDLEATLTADEKDKDLLSYDYFFEARKMTVHTGDGRTYEFKGSMPSVSGRVENKENPKRNATIKTVCLTLRPPTSDETDISTPENKQKNSKGCDRPELGFFQTKTNSAGYYIFNVSWGDVKKQRDGGNSQELSIEDCSDAFYTFKNNPFTINGNGGPSNVHDALEILK